MSQEALKNFKKHGYQTIVDLRTKPEMSWDEKAAAEKMGMKYISLPVAGATGMGKANAIALAKILKANAKKPIVIHCSSGNRVGALLAIKAFFVDKKSKKEAMQVASKTGVTMKGIEGHLRNILK